MKKEKEQKKKRIDWKRTFKNNGYMLGLIIKACPGVPILALISTVLDSVHSFLLNTYLYQYALNVRDFYNHEVEDCDYELLENIASRITSTSKGSYVLNIIL